jgi:hypothetical protein
MTKSSCFSLVFLISTDFSNFISSCFCAMLALGVSDFFTSSLGYSATLSGFASALGYSTVFATGFSSTFFNS